MHQHSTQGRRLAGHLAQLDTQGTVSAPKQQ
jgi:hypothetical protein